jgi:ETFB lysine methyltransferase
VAATKTVTVRAGGQDYRLRSLADRTQRDDPMFGVLWPSGIALAEEMSAFPIGGKRILEAGCGLALPSLVLKRRGADITATDHHPEAGEFLRFNADANGLPPVPFRLAGWENADLGRFDLIIGADLLYEPNHPALLAAFISCHAAPGAQVVIADPGRRQLSEFNKLMAAQGYARTEKKHPPGVRVLTYTPPSANSLR